MEADELLLSAQQLQRQGQLREAERHYRQILQDRPDWAPALLHLGMLVGQTGRLAAAADLLSRAVEGEPGNALYHNQLGVALARSGDFGRGAGCFERAVELQDDYFEAWNNLGNVLRNQNRPDEAIAAYERALQLKPDYAEAHFNMGNALRDRRRPGDAVAAYRRAIEFRPNLPDAHNNLGTVLIEIGQYEQAVATFEELIRLTPRFAKAYNNLGVTLLKLGRLDEAANRFRQAIALDGAYAAARGNLAVVMRQEGTRLAAPLAGRGPLRGPGDDRTDRRSPTATAPSPAQTFLNQGVSLGKSGDLEAAATNLRKAIELDPNYAEAHFNLGVALGDLHQIDQAMAAFGRAIQLRPEYAEARHALAMVQLQRGCFELGWPDYEYRWKLPSGPTPYRHRRPQWRGESLERKTILLHAEQGLGDTLQFARYIPMVAERAQRVYLWCQAPLERLISQWPKVHLLTDLSQRLPSYDLHCAVTSLPLAFGTRLESIPADVPYLLPDPLLVENWKRRLDGSKRLRVGLVWAGNPQHQNDRQRSIALSRLAPLAKFADRVAFYGLQKGEAARQRTDIPELNLIDLSDELNDFVDTAAVISCLDLLISVDTAVAHLAGALGKPAWTLLAFASDWRWMLDRTDSPWYPTMRLFRQRTAGDWEEPVAQVIAALGNLLDPKPLG
jgi:tetratricopeptide (TPR) repeat protein